MKATLARQFSWVLLMLALSGCQSADQDYRNAQAVAFLSSIELIESAGQKLQVANPGSQLIDEAMKQLDSALQQAYQVEDEFLAKLDARLSKFYKSDLLKGVEDYRLGIESGDTDQQLKGLMQLQKWNQFWQSEGEAIRAKLSPTAQ